NVEEYKPIQNFCLHHKSLGFDPSIYRENGQYKCVNQSKKDNRIQKIIEGSDNPLDHTLRCNIPEDVKSIENITFNEFLTPAKKRGRPFMTKQEISKKQKRLTKDEIDEAYVKPMDIPVPEGFDIYAADPSDILEIFPNPKRGEPHERPY